MNQFAQGKIDLTRMYINPSEELFKDDVKGYEAQPSEAHAKKVARSISTQLQE